MGVIVYIRASRPVEVYVEAPLHALERGHGLSYRFRSYASAERDGCRGHAVLHVHPARCAAVHILYASFRIDQVEMEAAQFVPDYVLRVEVGFLIVVGVAQYAGAAVFLADREAVFDYQCVAYL